jgi:ATP diphosphatase
MPNATKDQGLPQELAHAPAADAGLPLGDGAGAAVGDMGRLLGIMAALRDPERGCPWDREQTYASIVPHTLEEAYEVADTIERGAWDELPGELGDLLFQVVFYARIAAEEGRFDFATVVAGICAKLIGRHPHVFAAARIDSAAAQSLAWEGHKARERREKAQATAEVADRTAEEESLLDHLILALPALSRAAKLQKRAARVGLDWETVLGVLAKLDEEVAELKAALAPSGPSGQARAAAPECEEELGDLLFTCVNLARHLGLDAETALRRANAKFEARFRAMEGLARARGAGLAGLGPAALDRLWEEVKDPQGGDRSIPARATPAAPGTAAVSGASDPPEAPWPTG